MFSFGFLSDILESHSRAHGHGVIFRGARSLECPIAEPSACRWRGPSQPNSPKAPGCRERNRLWAAARKIVAPEFCRSPGGRSSEKKPEPAKPWGVGKYIPLRG